MIVLHILIKHTDIGKKVKLGTASMTLET